MTIGLEHYFTVHPTHLHLFVIILLTCLSDVDFVKNIDILKIRELFFSFLNKFGIAAYLDALYSNSFRNNVSIFVYSILCAQSRNSSQINSSYYFIAIEYF